MNEQATNNNPNKRTRFDPNVQTITDSPPFGETPTQALRNHTCSSFESLPSTTKSFAVDLCHKLVKLKNLEKRYETSLKKFDDEDYIPRSARISFVLRGSSRLENNPELEVLQSETAALVTTFQATLKEKIKSTTILERDSTRLDLRTLFCQSCKQLAQITYILNGKTATDEQIHNLAIYSVEKNEKCMKYTTCTTASFRSDFKKANDETYDHDPRTIVLSNEFKEYSSFLQHYLERIFFQSWRSVSFASIKIDRSKQSAKFITELNATSSNDASQMIVDNEPTVNPKLLQDLIDQAVLKKTTQLVTQINRVASKLERTNPNKPRGAPPSASSSKKTNQNGQAAGMNNGGNKDKQNKSNKQSKKRSNNNNKRSTKSNRRSGGS